MLSVLYHQAYFLQENLIRLFEKESYFHRTSPLSLQLIDTCYLWVHSKQVSSMLFIFFCLTPCLIVPGQACMEGILIKKIPIHYYTTRDNTTQTIRRESSIHKKIQNSNQPEQPHRHLLKKEKKKEMSRWMPKRGQSRRMMQRNFLSERLQLTVYLNLCTQKVSNYFRN